MSAPTLAAITLHPTGGGVAVVANLLWSALQETHGAAARLVTIFDHESRPSTFAENVQFGTHLLWTQATRRARWILFSHLGLTRAQHVVPEAFWCPYGVFIHGIEAWGPITAGERRVLQRARLRVANSSFTANRVMQQHPDIGPVLVCPLASLGTSAPIGSADDLDIGRHAVLVVGRMSAAERYKGHDQLIEAWPDVVRRLPDARLIMAGGGDDRARLEDKARALGLHDRIVFTGYIDDTRLAALYQRAALFALPSRGEGFGLVYLEAMSRGLPCVGSIHDAAGEVVVDGVTGRLVDQGDTTGIANTIAELLEDTVTRQRMGAAARRHVASTFTIDRFRGRIGQLIADAFGDALTT